MRTLGNCPATPCFTLGSSGVCSMAKLRNQAQTVTSSGCLDWSCFFPETMTAPNRDQTPPDDHKFYLLWLKAKKNITRTP